MEERDRGVVLDREETVRHDDVDASSNPQELVDKVFLLLDAADMLENRVGCRYIKLKIIKGQSLVLVYLNIMNLWKRTTKSSPSPRPTAVM